MHRRYPPELQEPCPCSETSDFVVQLSRLVKVDVARLLHRLARLAAPFSMKVNPGRERIQRGDGIQQGRQSLRCRGPAALLTQAWGRNSRNGGRLALARAKAAQPAADRGVRAPSGPAARQITPRASD